MSERQAAGHFGISRASVKKKMMFSVPPSYQRTAQIKRPKLDGFTGFIDKWMQDDLNRPRKQRHTAKRIFERLRDEHQFRGGYMTVKNYVREQGRRSREMFVPLAHAPGHAKADFGEAMVVIGGVSRRRISLRWICHSVMRALCVHIQRRCLKLGLMAMSTPLRSLAVSRSRFFMTMTDALLRRSCLTDRASGPSCLAGSYRMTSSMIVMADRVRAMIKVPSRVLSDTRGVTSWCPSLSLRHGRRSIFG
jgi:hypothetical protein